jgi:transcriptional regulator with XRE-family HTH domain
MSEVLSIDARLQTIGIYKNVYVGILKGIFQGQNQKAFAIQSGISEVYLSRILRGHSVPTPDVADRIALHVPITATLKTELRNYMIATWELVKEQDNSLRVEHNRFIPDDFARSLYAKLRASCNLFPLKNLWLTESWGNVEQDRLNAEALTNEHLLSGIDGLPVEIDDQYHWIYTQGRIMLRANPAELGLMMAESCLILSHIALIMLRLGDALYFCQVGRYLITQWRQNHGSSKRIQLEIDRLDFHIAHRELMAYNYVGNPTSADQVALRMMHSRLIQDPIEGHKWLPLFYPQWMDAVSIKGRFSIKDISQKAEQVQHSLLRSAETHGSHYTWALAAIGEQNRALAFIIYHIRNNQPDHIKTAVYRLQPFVNDAENQLLTNPHFGPLEYSGLLGGYSVCLWKLNNNDAWKHYMTLALKTASANGYHNLAPYYKRQFGLPVDELEIAL